MCNFIAAAANTMQGFLQAGATLSASKGQASIYKANAAGAENQAKDAEQRGAIEETNYRQQLAKYRGTQKATIAANGIRSNSGSAQAIIDDTNRIGELDSLTIRSNAAREAYGYKVQAQDLRNNARFVRKQGKTQAILDVHQGIANGASSFF